MEERDPVKLMTKFKDSGGRECPFCRHFWYPRKENPKACPRCKKYFGYYRKKDRVLEAKNMNVECGDDPIDRWEESVKLGKPDEGD